MLCFKALYTTAGGTRIEVLLQRRYLLSQYVAVGFDFVQLLAEITARLL